MWPNLQFSVDLVTFTEEMLNEKLYIVCSVFAMISYQRTLLN